MRYMQNEKGNALLLVLLVMVIMSTIGLAVVSSTIGGAKRTTVRTADVDITYESIKAMDSFTAGLSDQLRTNAQLALANVTPASIDILLDQAGNTVVEQVKAENAAIEDIQVRDITGEYSIDKDIALTRVLSVSITAKENEGAAVSRTAHKELIVSPLPSFLKYALGSEKGRLSLNGSPHLEGNIFANTLSIDEKAHYLTQNGTNLSQQTPKPSISGDIYVGTPGSYTDWDFDPQALTNVLVPENFYHEEVPGLKNDSQYQDVQFSQAYTEGRRAAEEKTKFLTTLPVPDNPAKNVSSTSEKLTTYETDKNGKSKRVTLSLSEYEAIADGLSDVDYKGDAVLEPRGKQIENIRVKGSLTIFADHDLVLKNIFVSGGTLTIVNRNSSTLQLEEQVVSDGGILIENEAGMIDSKEAQLYDDESITINNESQSVSFYSISSHGNITVTNHSGTVELMGPLWTQEHITLHNEGEMTVDFPNSDSNTVFSGEEMKIMSTGTFTLKNHLVSERSITLDLSDKAALEGLILAKNNINLYVQDSKKGDIYFEGSLFTDQNLTIQGNDEKSSHSENDFFSIDATMYAREKTSISNLSIRGWNDGQLVSLSGDSLLITRINEFQNLEESTEPRKGLYVPDLNENSTVQPLKGFFYTDKDVQAGISEPAAELYGVGSLFLVDGGVFAKGDFIVNAVRGETDGFNIQSAIPSLSRQDGHYSRFIIQYDRNILLGQLDYLPRVKYLSVYSDQLTVQ
ncbi:hypothetical protein RRU94_13670 [Domibacillus sp. DTU_2020_1001157_1_SI_ALB_TIR_016]|uniref:hypothetical protein n=1 Tax=Domibacillus sp. DTU_2020_1001157_1_SI_ALB_TIR_016 TaxID=3077789 RepID=UPI0028E9B252|nr:hypothetical protein [Domibacillus sp. DTU_2020_1001157_1_SI_ALB_TIR_016]WNS81806.1 hypothetical protein RRU94_13670 [Domibacillus sp. DTU_2020_1001157_1_SI_ALB_TIR_016]